MAMNDRFHQLRGERFSQMANMAPGATGMDAVRGDTARGIVDQLLASRGVPNTPENQAAALQYLLGGQLQGLASQSTTEADIASQALQNDDGGLSAAPAMQSPQDAGSVPTTEGAPTDDMGGLLPGAGDAIFGTDSTVTNAMPIEDPASAPIDTDDLMTVGIGAGGAAGLAYGIAKLFGAARGKGAKGGSFSTKRAEALRPQGGASVNAKGEFASQTPAAEAARSGQASQPEFSTNRVKEGEGPTFQSRNPDAQRARASSGRPPQPVNEQVVWQNADRSTLQNLEGNTMAIDAKSGNGVFIVNGDTGKSVFIDKGDIAALSSNQQAYGQLINEAVKMTQ